jgi:hypothetical protein
MCCSQEISFFPNDITDGNESSLPGSLNGMPWRDLSATHNRKIQGTVHESQRYERESC